MLIAFPCALRHLALTDRAAFAAELGLVVPDAWPNPNFAEVLPRIQARYDTDEFVFLIVEDGQVVGEIGAKDPPDARGMIEIGYGVIPAARRRGITSCAVAELADHVKMRGVRVLRADCNVDNVGSIRVLERSGFTRIGEGEDEDGPLILWERRLG